MIPPDTPLPAVDPALLSLLRDQVNNPLAAIDVEAQLILLSDEAAASPELREAAERIIAQCRRVAAFLRELRALAPPRG